MLWQTVQTQIKLPHRSNMQSLHCLPFYLHLLDKLLNGKTSMIDFQRDYGKHFYLQTVFLSFLCDRHLSFLFYLFFPVFVFLSPPRKHQINFGSDKIILHAEETVMMCFSRIRILASTPTTVFNGSFCYFAFTNWICVAKLVHNLWG